MTDVPAPSAAPRQWPISRAQAPRDRGLALRRGLMCRCPACGEGKLYGKFLKVNPTCSACGERLDAHRADDAPPYMVITIVGHVVLTGIMLQEEWVHDTPYWLYAVIWLPAALVMSLALLPSIKGALIGWQWALRMHGFDTPAPLPASAREAQA